MPTYHERPRLTVLQNFKEISRIMTNTYMKNKQLESRYNARVPADELDKKEQEERATQEMINKMKLLISPKKFQPIMRKPGQSIEYMNVSQARSMIMDKAKYSMSAGHRGNANSTLSAKKHMDNSLFGRSSQYDRANASTTVDGTLASLQYPEVSLKTDVDPLEQAHNNMNLALGKPTQNFAPQPTGAKKRNLEKLYGPKQIKKLNNDNSSLSKKHH